MGASQSQKPSGKLQSDLIEAQRELLSSGGINCAIDLSITLIFFPFALTVSCCAVPTGFLIMLCMIGPLQCSLDWGSRCCCRWRSPLRPTSPSTLAPLTLVCICLSITLLVAREILLWGTAFYVSFIKLIQLPYEFAPGGFRFKRGGVLMCFQTWN